MTAHLGPDGRFRNPWPHSEPHGPWALLRWARERRSRRPAPSPSRGSFPTAKPAIAYPRAARGRVHRDLDRAFHRAAPDRWDQRPDRSRVQRASVPGAVDGAAPGDGPGARDRRAASARRGPAVAQPLRSPRPAGGEAARPRPPRRNLDRAARAGRVHPSPGARATSSSWTGGRRRAHTALRVTATPARHFSARRAGDRNRSLWCGFAVALDGMRLWFAGDTAYHPEFGEIGARCGPFDFVMIPIGAYEPRWFMERVHVDPEEAVRIYRDMTPRMRRPAHARHSLGHVQADRRADGRAAPAHPEALA